MTDRRSLMIGSKAANRPVQTPYAGLVFPRDLHAYYRPRRQEYESATSRSGPPVAPDPPHRTKFIRRKR